MTGRTSDGEPLTPQQRTRLLDAQQHLTRAARELAEQLGRSATNRIVTYRPETEAALRAAHRLSEIAVALLNVEVLLARRDTGRVDPVTWEVIADLLALGTRQTAINRFKAFVSTRSVSQLSDDLATKARGATRLATDLKLVRSGRAAHAASEAVAEEQRVEEARQRRSDARFRRKFPRRREARRRIGDDDVDPPPAWWKEDLAARGLLRTGPQPMVWDDDTEEGDAEEGHGEAERIDDDAEIDDSEIDDAEIDRVVERIAQRYDHDGGTD